MEFEKLQGIIAEVLNVDTGGDHNGYHICR